MQMKTLRCHFVSSTMANSKEQREGGKKEGRKKGEKEALVRMWGTWSPHTPLMEKQNSALTLENSLAGRQKVEHRVSV